MNFFLLRIRIFQSIFTLFCFVALSIVLCDARTRCPNIVAFSSSFVSSVCTHASSFFFFGWKWKVLNNSLNLWSRVLPFLIPKNLGSSYDHVMNGPRVSLFVEIKIVVIVTRDLLRRIRWWYMTAVVLVGHAMRVARVQDTSADMYGILKWLIYR